MKTLTLSIACALSALVCASAFGAVTVEPGKEGAAPATPKSDLPSGSRLDRKPMGTAVGSAGNITPIGKAVLGSNMKCWQDGKLIIDQPVKVLPSEAKNGTTLVNADTGTPMHTFDFRNALCVVK
jgi:hypothetical protein